MMRITMALENNVDILPIGIGYGTLGIARPNATINWQAENNLNWTDTLAGGTNYKHIDCNGDGIIADDDTIAILQNFGLTHPLRVTQRLQNITDPPLYFDIIVDTVGTSQQLDIPLYFGTSTIPADSIYGMAFTVNYDTSLVKADSVQIGFSPSWLGTTGSDLIYISKNDTQNGKLYVGVTRINQNDTSGFGEIARVTVVTTDNVSGRLSQPIYDTLHFSISDLTIINVDEIERNAYVTGDSLIIEDLTALDELDQLKKNIFVFPNPAKENVNVKSSFAKVVSVQLTDVAGKQLNDSGSDNNPLIKRLNDFEFCININSLQKGMYLINIKTNSGTITKRFTVAD
ncbi:MAG: T9SS type A sorting domain-containing protein [Bacteroidetes bacterium]|nr:T9SS type A sorting domain-containing protein [Bacteroidota bacterium]